MNRPENVRGLCRVVEAVQAAWIYPFGSNQCHRWVGAARDNIVALGPNTYDNDEFTVTYVDWTITSGGTAWGGHGGLRISFANGTVAYFDNGFLGGNDRIAFPEDKANAIFTLSGDMGVFPLVPAQEVPSAIPIKEIWDAIMGR